MDLVENMVFKCKGSVKKMIESFSYQDDEGNYYVSKSLLYMTANLSTLGYSGQISIGIHKKTIEYWKIHDNLTLIEYCQFSSAVTKTVKLNWRMYKH